MVRMTHLQLENVSKKPLWSTLIARTSPKERFQTSGFRAATSSSLKFARVVLPLFWRAGGAWG